MSPQERNPWRLRAGATALLVATVPLFPGCGGNDSGSPAPSPVAGTNQGQGADPAAKGGASKPLLAAKIKFKGPGGAASFSLKPTADGAKLLDGTDKEMARYVLKGTKLSLQVKEPDPDPAASDDGKAEAKAAAPSELKEVLFGYVTSSGSKLKIKDAKQEKEYLVLHIRGDGLKIEDGDLMLCKVSAKDYGYKAEDADDGLLFKVKNKAGKISVRTAADVTTLYTKDAVHPLAVAVLGEGRIPLWWRVGLMLQLDRRLSN